MHLWYPGRSGIVPHNICEPHPYTLHFKPVCHAVPWVCLTLPSPHLCSYFIKLYSILNCQFTVARQSYQAYPLVCPSKTLLSTVTELVLAIALECIVQARTGQIVSWIDGVRIGRWVLTGSQIPDQKILTSGALSYGQEQTEHHQSAALRSHSKKV